MSLLISLRASLPSSSVLITNQEREKTIKKNKDSKENKVLSNVH